MNTADLFLPILIATVTIGTVLLLVAVVKTVRYHGWGQQRWAPSAVPWFVSGFGVILLGVIAAFVTSNVA
ncbi:hypothetical protein [Curtobacterium sp. Leaf261]|uniref:hypothetical protein n=1 Tax=Curtobacterium sp. Leaf261 TaxID=1736311 RepID=UPI0006F5EDF2|nr:hypothetical protein [Curtobacterium sp. Leaf261]KQO64519.1 hypothetical protein ASF23_16145 [Curtobacterium sp. Leaf261]